MLALSRARVANDTTPDVGNDNEQPQEYIEAAGDGIIYSEPVEASGLSREAPRAGISRSSSGGAAPVRRAGVRD